jgi:hypothetical protein
MRMRGGARDVRHRARNDAIIVTRRKNLLPSLLGALTDQSKPRIMLGCWVI